MLTPFSYPNYPTADGHLTTKVRQKYIDAAIADKVLPQTAHRMPQIISLNASNESNKPIQFWQLYSVLGPDRIMRIVQNFYERVYKDEPWFSSVFARVGGMNHHIATQSGMWIDTMGGGPAYHGGEFRLSFHHTHNAMSLMNKKGAERWHKLMVEALDASTNQMTVDARVRPSINTFLTHFFGKYAAEFNFSNQATFGATNPPFQQKMNFMNMKLEAIEALSETELKEALSGRGIDVTRYKDKRQLVDKALSL